MEKNCHSKKGPILEKNQMIADIVPKGFPNPKVQKYRRGPIMKKKPYDDCRIESTCYISS